MSSKVPSELNENWGSNYLMDGYRFDMQYNKGVEDGIGSTPEPDPPTSGMSKLPDGVMMSEDMGEWDIPLGISQDPDSVPHLGELEIVAAEDEIIDLSWLSDATQDPERLPFQPNDRVLEGLHESWKNRTDGIIRLDYRERVSSEAPKTKASINLKSLLRLAMRRSASGESFKAIRRDLKAQLGPRYEEIKPSMKILAKEHGLHGNVFIRASAFPRLHRGRYAKKLKALSKRARWLIADSSENVEACAGVLNLKVVRAPSEIPWKRQAAHYRSFLETTGRTLDSSLPARERLRKAFLQEGSSPRLDIETTKVSIKSPSERVTSEEARKAFQGFTPPAREVLSLVEKFKKAEQEKLQKKLGSWAKARLLTSSEVNKLLSSGAPPKDIIKAASQIIQKVKTRDYVGSLFDSSQDYTLEEIWNNLKGASEDWERLLKKKAEKTLRQAREKAIKRIGSWVEARLISPQEAQVLLQSKCSSSELLKKASKIASSSKKRGYEVKGRLPTKEKVSSERVQEELLEASRVRREKQADVKREAFHEKMRQKALLIERAIKSGVRGKKLSALIRRNIKAEELKFVSPLLSPILEKTGALKEKKAKTKKYAGKVYTQHISEKPVVKTSKEDQAAFRWVKKQMNEGMAGRDLDDLIQLKLSTKQASSEQLVQIRKKHEGLAGHLYVDASVYASSKGTTGCERGATRHRANTIQYVLQMPRCATCVSKNANGTCQKYNKQIVETPPVDVEKYQREMLAAHNMTDAEVTASLFTGIQEYQLHNDHLDSIEFEDTSVEKIGEVLFGGMVL